jgi:polyisoprenoid-binding protein YceI
MRRLALSLLLACFAIAPASAQTKVPREIDPVASKAHFTVQHIYVERVTGTVPISRGTIVVPENSAVPLAVWAELDPTKIKSGDDDRDGALQAPEWFDSKKFPAWTFTSTKIVSAGPNAFAMDGLLTIHGVTRPERLDVAISGSPAHPVYHATGTIDRHAFGMSVTRLDPVIGNPIEIALDIVLK